MAIPEGVTINGKVPAVSYLLSSSYLHYDPKICEIRRGCRRVAMKSVKETLRFRVR